MSGIFAEKKGERMIRRNESLSMFSSLISYCQVSLLLQSSFLLLAVFLRAFFIIHGFFFFYYSHVSLYFTDGQRYLQANLRIHTIIYMRNFMVFRK